MDRKFPTKGIRVRLSVLGREAGIRVRNPDSVGVTARPSYLSSLHGREMVAVRWDGTQTETIYAAVFIEAVPSAAPATEGRPPVTDDARPTTGAGAPRLTAYQRRVLMAAAEPHQRLRYATSEVGLKKRRCRWHLGGFGPVRASAARALEVAGLIALSPGESSAYLEIYELTDAGRAAATEGDADGK